MNTIRKYGMLIVKDGRFLVNRKHGTKLFIMPGGRPEGEETPEQCIAREIMEEHGCSVIASTLRLFGDYTERAVNEPDTMLHITVYSGNIAGEPHPAAEIEEQRWFGKDDDASILSPTITKYILPDIIKRKMI